MPLKIKKENLSKQIGFNNSGLPLGIRTDLHILAKIGLDGKDQSILDLFETVPTEKEIADYQGEQFLAANPSPEAIVPSPVTPAAAAGNTTPAAANAGDKK